MSLAKVAMSLAKVHSARGNSQNPDARFRPRTEDMTCKFCGDTVDRAPDAAINHLAYACRRAPAEVREAAKKGATQ